MKIYTKTGDKGETSILGGKRLPKSHLRIEAYGTVDELNSHVGLVKDQEVNQKRQDLLLNIQNQLFIIGSILATDPEKSNVKIPSLYEKDIQVLEEAIDAMNEEIPPLTNFVLPGGHPAISFGHLARTVCRRAERNTIALSLEEKVDELIIQYLNRLSDYFFTLCRKMHQELDIPEIPWKSRD